MSTEESRSEVTRGHCAGIYDVLCNPIGCEARSAQAVNPEIILENLKSCQEYKVSVTAILGEENSDEAKMTFMTKPQHRGR